MDKLGENPPLSATVFKEDTNYEVENQFIMR